MRAKKILGQHFIKCRWAVSAMVKAAELKPDDVVLEVGPGTGALTKALAAKAKTVIAAEKDENLADELRHRLKKEKIFNVSVIKADALKLLQSGCPRFNKVAANIPYYLTSRLLRLLLQKSPPPELIVLTVQKEVAQRICAKPGKMNLLAASVQAFGTPSVSKEIPKECFYPQPKVKSRIIKIKTFGGGGEFRKWRTKSADFFRAAKIIFSQKRKTTLNNLAPVFGKERALEILKNAGIKPGQRAEELNVYEISKLARAGAGGDKN